MGRPAASPVEADGFQDAGARRGGKRIASSGGLIPPAGHMRRVAVLPGADRYNFEIILQVPGTAMSIISARRRSRRGASYPGARSRIGGIQRWLHLLAASSRRRQEHPLGAARCHPNAAWDSRRMQDDRPASTSPDAPPSGDAQRKDNPRGHVVTRTDRVAQAAVDSAEDKPAPHGTQHEVAGSPVRSP
jgi:hypothetical protein